MRHEFEVKQPDAGRRLDRFLRTALGNVPPSLVQRLLRQKKVRVNDARGSGDLRLRAGDVVVVHHAVSMPSRPSTARNYAGPPIAVLHAAEDFLFVDKPAGVTCSDDGQDRATLALWLAEHLASAIARGEVRPQPCHRLDRGTTGVVAVALTVAAFERFRRALEAGAVHKQYEVAVWGAPAQERWICEQSLLRRERVVGNEPRVVPVEAEAVARGRAWSATTEFEVITRGQHATLLRAHPHTGRTHQIRAHCRASGLAIVGDPRYGDAQRDADWPDVPVHPLLHARRLRLDDAFGSLEVTAEWPPEEARVLHALGLITD